MARTIMLSLSSLSEHASDALDDTASESSRNSQVQVTMLPIKDAIKSNTNSNTNSNPARKPSKRSSWKFNTDWESAISSFKSGSSLLSSSLSSWYHVLDIEDEVEEEEQLQLEQNVKVQQVSVADMNIDSRDQDARGSARQRPSWSKENSFKRPSLHSTMLSDEEQIRSSFSVLSGKDGGQVVDVAVAAADDMNEYLESLNRNRTSTTCTTVELPSDEKENADAAAAIRRLSELINMKYDNDNDYVNPPALDLMQSMMTFEKEECELIQERIYSLEELDEELKRGDLKGKARAA